MLSTSAIVSGEVFNVSDIIVDRRELLEMVGEITGVAKPLPAAVDPSTLNVMSCEKLRALGWQPGGRAKLAEFLRSSLANRGPE
jgi:nucleoside-diphosphate-sugar epimerase